MRGGPAFGFAIGGMEFYSVSSRACAQPRMDVCMRAKSLHAASSDNVSDEGRCPRRKQCVIKTPARIRESIPVRDVVQRRRRQQRREDRQDCRAAERDSRADEAIAVAELIGCIAVRAVCRGQLSMRDRSARDSSEIAAVDVAERQRDLQRQRKQRQRSTKAAFGSKPPHARNDDVR